MPDLVQRGWILGHITCGRADYTLQKRCPSLLHSFDGDRVNTERDGTQKPALAHGVSFELHLVGK